MPLVLGLWAIVLLVLGVVVALHFLVELGTQLFDLLGHLIPHFVPATVQLLLRGTDGVSFRGRECLAGFALPVSRFQGCLSSLCDIVDRPVRNLRRLLFCTSHESTENFSNRTDRRSDKFFNGIEDTSKEAATFCHLFII